MRISDWSSDVCSSDLAKSRESNHDCKAVRASSQRSRCSAEAILGMGSGVCATAAHARTSWTSEGESRSCPWARSARSKIGRASCRERVCQYVSISVVAVSLKKKKKKDENEEDY